MRHLNADLNEMNLIIEHLLFFYTRAESNSKISFIRRFILYYYRRFIGNDSTIITNESFDLKHSLLPFSLSLKYKMVKRSINFN